MSPRRTHLLASLLIAALLLAALALPLLPVFAQEATPQATAAVPAAVTETAAPPSTPGTPTPSPTPTLTPTATPTLTALQAQLVLAQTYLDGKDYARAATLFAAIAETDRGNPEALMGLKAALDGQAAASAPAAPPTPTPAPAPAPAAAPAAKAGLADTLEAKLRDFGGTAVAALLVVVLVYLLASALRWLLFWLRELWFVRILPLLRRPAVQPGYLIGEFGNGIGEAGANVPQIVTQALAEKLVAWNQLVHAKEVAVEPAPTLDLGGMGWLKVLWSWILPPQRGYKVSGMILQGPTGAYQLSVQRTDLRYNSIDLSTTLDKRGASPDAVFRALAGEAAKWLVAPADMQASDAIVRGMRAVRGVDAEAVGLTSSEIFDQALELLLPVRQQVNQGAIDFNYARKQLQDAESLLSQLPAGSQLRSDLEGVIADLRRSVPGG